ELYVALAAADADERSEFEERRHVDAPADARIEVEAQLRNEVRDLVRESEAQPEPDEAKPDLRPEGEERTLAIVHAQRGPELEPDEAGSRRRRGHCQIARHEQRGRDTERMALRHGFSPS